MESNLWGHLRGAGPATPTRGDGDGFGEVEEGRVHKEDREVDGGSEERTNLRARVLAAIPSGVCGICDANRAPVEPAWIGR
ncbi:hypothetical protein AHAS_Ahas18G0189700 [Arachis hypogaea]